MFTKFPKEHISVNIWWTVTSKQYALLYIMVYVSSFSLIGCKLKGEIAGNKMLKIFKGA